VRRQAQPHQRFGELRRDAIRDEDAVRDLARVPGILLDRVVARDRKDSVGAERARDDVRAPKCTVSPWKCG
jgi:hypothetical protein